MIRYALRCAAGCVFDAWFSKSADFDDQKSAGLLTCPHCGEMRVEKAVMAPAVRSSRRAAATQGEALRRALASWRKEVEATHEHVGGGFSSEVRKIADGEAEDRPIYGQATLADAIELVEEGLPVLPLPNVPADEEIN